MSAPTQLYLVPVYFMFRKLNLVNTQLGVCIIYIATFLPFAIFLLRSYFIGISKEIEESAKVDGCTELGVIRYITIPLAKPAFATVSLVVGVWVWNEFMFANIFLMDDKVRTVATRYVTFVGEFSINMAYIYTAGALTILPIIVLYLLLQRSFIEGMTSGGVKG